MSQRSISSFFGGGERKETEKRKSDDITGSISSKNKKYDTEKRQRKFISSWKTLYPWVVHDEEQNVMRCEICVKFPDICAKNRKHAFVDGCNNFRLDYLKSHDTSDAHLECVSYHKAALKSQGNVDCSSSIPTSISETAAKIKPIVKAFKSIDTYTLRRLDRLFITAFQIAHKGKPLSDFEANLELLERLDVDVGTKYRNNAGVRSFIHAIALSFRKSFLSELKNAKFLTIMSDGSTDTAVMEQETVFVRYVSLSGEPISFHAATVPLSHCHADGVLEGIKSAVSTLGFTYENLVDPDYAGPHLVSVNFDGAAVMLGSKGGVAAKIKDDANYVVPVHCIAHKLELAVLDSVKDLPQLASFENTLKQVLKFYYYSPKMRRELKQVSEIFNTELVSLSDVKQVRWLASKIRAVQALKIGFHTIINHIESVATGRTEQSAKAKGWLKKMLTSSFIKVMSVLLDILPILTEVSLLFQTEDLLIIEVSGALEGLILKLMNLKIEPLLVGEHMRNFSDKYNHETGTYDGIRLRDSCTPIIFKEDVFLNSLLDGMMKYLDKRFACFSQKPLKCFSVFNYADWPSDRAALSVYGNTDLSELVDHYALLFPDEKSLILREFTELKGHLKSCKQPVLETYIKLLVDKPERFVHVIKIIELMFVMSPGTAVCERLFSNMNLVKTNH
ncbi:zinc finger protein 862-like [Haliotis rubra]|uniref:zinc finger protein 862-like n=1 Tax=Haliotis rubra TaxID=36100 RepID=UPI001EE5F760|nr:zinc finger protein 862-like [Haliotis rubra]XP_046569513.1 zinc finger protein 862-like [Haliotis rubra]